MTRLLPVALILGACTDLPASDAPPTTAPPLSANARVAWTAEVSTSARGISLDAGELMILHEDGELERMTLHDQSRRTRDVSIFQATDMAAIGDGRFVVTVPGDGLLFDPVEGVGTQHFCYEPGFMDEQMWELTDAVAVDADRSVIYAAPQTFQGGEPIASSIGVWDLATGGEPTSWFTLPWPDFAAGGMIVDGPDALILGFDSILLAYPLGGDATPIVDLARLGITRIDGLALTADDALIVLDGQQGTIQQIEDWR